MALDYTIPAVVFGSILVIYWQIYRRNRKLAGSSPRGWFRILARLTREGAVTLWGEMGEAFKYSESAAFMDLKHVGYPTDKIYNWINQNGTYSLCKTCNKWMDFGEQKERCACEAQKKTHTIEQRQVKRALYFLNAEDPTDPRFKGKSLIFSFLPLDQEPWCVLTGKHGAGPLLEEVAHDVDAAAVHRTGRGEFSHLWIMCPVNRDIHGFDLVHQSLQELGELMDAVATLPITAQTVAEKQDFERRLKIATESNERLGKVLTKTSAERDTARQAAAGASNEFEPQPIISTTAPILPRGDWWKYMIPAAIVAYGVYAYYPQGLGGISQPLPAIVIGLLATWALRYLRKQGGLPI